MKANEAPDFPEKVYIPRDPEYPQSPNLWWEREPSENNIEYTNTDAFIEKACEWLLTNASDYCILHNSYDTKELVKDFVDAMKRDLLWHI